MNLIRHQLGNRNPSLADTISVDGAAQNISAGTVRFRMRAVGSSTLKVDTAAVVLDDGSAPLRGQVRYDWAALDVDTADFYVCWWQVTIAGKTQDTPEFLLQVVAHAPASGDLCELADVRLAAGITGDARDGLITELIPVASRAVCNRYERELAPRVDAVTRRFHVSSRVVDLAPYDLRGNPTTVTLHPESSSPTVLALNTDVTLLPVGGHPLTGTSLLLKLSRYITLDSSHFDSFGFALVDVAGNWGAWNTDQVSADVRRGVALTVASWIDKAIEEYGLDSGDEPRAQQPDRSTSWAIPAAAHRLFIGAGVPRMTQV